MSDEFRELFTALADASSEHELETLVPRIRAVSSTEDRADLRDFWQRRWFELSDRPLESVRSLWVER